MATIISVIQPGGASGTKYNVRATGIRHFLRNATPTAATPTEGYVSLNNNIVRITCSQITELFSGLMFTADIPAISAENTTLKINSLGAKSIKLADGASTKAITGNATYLVVYNGTDFIIMDSIETTNVVSGITNGSYKVPTANAVYNYVTNQLSNRWAYVISEADQSKIPNGAVYKSGNTTITGTLPANADTEYKIFLVLHEHDTAHGPADAYDEWITVKDGNGNYSWEKIGNTDIDVSDIAASISSSIIGSIADHKYNRVNSASVSIGSHNHTFKGSVITSTGTVALADAVYTSMEEVPHSESYVPQGKISIGTTVDGVRYQPAGRVESSFSGTGSYIKINGTQATITVSTKNVPTGNNTAAKCTVSWGTGDGYATTVPTVSVTGISNVTLSTDTTTGGSHTHTISGNGTSSAINGSSFTVSTQSAMSVSISSATASSSDYTFIVPLEVRIATQAEYTTAGGGSHTHLGTVNQRTLSGTITSVGTASSYTVNGEVLTLTPNTVPGSAVSVTFSTASVNINTVSNHTHTVTRSRDATTYAAGGRVKLTAATPAHKHTLSGSVTPTITMGGTISTAGSHRHTTTFTSESVANVLKVKTEAIGLLINIGTHTHTISTITASTTYTPAVTIATRSSSATGYTNITPKGTVISTFTGEKTNFGFDGVKTYFALKKVDTSISVSGTAAGTIGTKDLGTKTVALSTSSISLTHRPLA